MLLLLHLLLLHLLLVLQLLLVLLLLLLLLLDIILLNYEGHGGVSGEARAYCWEGNKLKANSSNMSIM